MLEVVKEPLTGVKIIKPEVHRDDRGVFTELYSETIYKTLGISDNFVQDNFSTSFLNVVRGLHYSVKPQAQLVTVLEGEIYDVVVDLRRSSRTFGQCFGCVLTAFGNSQIYMAPGFAHGFCVLSDQAYMNYKVSQIFDPTDNHGIIWNDETLEIDWPCKQPLISQRDKCFGKFKEILL